MIHVHEDVLVHVQVERLLTLTGELKSDVPPAKGANGSLPEIHVQK